MSNPKAAQVCLNILSNLSGIELLQYDVSKGAFVHLDWETCEFDPTTRDILEGPEYFKSILKLLLDRNNIPLKTPTNLVVPSFFTRQFTVPEDIMGEDLVNILTAEAEQFYVFRKVDPEIGYCGLKDNVVLYTAYPKQAIESIQDAFQQLKIPLNTIDCNLTATLRGLVGMGVVQQEVNAFIPWGMIIVSEFTIFMSLVEGYIIDKVSETSFSLQNTDEATLLATLHEDFQQFFGFEVINRLVIVNNSVQIKSTSIIDALKFEGATDVFDQNEATLTSRGSAEGPFPCSLEAIGGALVRAVPQIAPLNLRDAAAIEAEELGKKQTKVAILLALAGLLFFGFQFGVGYFIDTLIKSEEEKGAQIQSTINQSMMAFSVIPEVKRLFYAKKSVLQNSRFNNLIVKAREILPQDAWFTDILIESDAHFKPMDVTFKGGALSSEPLNTFVSEIGKEVTGNPMMPQVVPQTKNDQRYFDYRISNVPLSDTAQPGTGGM